MKRLLPILLFCLTSLVGQSQHLPKNMEGPRVAPLMEQPSPMPLLSVTDERPAPSLGFRDEEVQIGVTRFELQTIACLGRRVATLPDGRVSAAWLHGLDQTGGWPDRGAAYNQFDGSAWGDAPDFSLEATRSGYPSFTSSPNGLEVVFSHKNTSATQWYLQTHTKMPDDTDWTEVEIPSTVTGGPVWGKVAVGGPDGNTIHAVAVAVAPDFGGVIYEGVNQHPLYYRSTDGGATWDMVDVIIPGLDSNFYSRVTGEAYNIYANGETVAIAVFEAWGDIAVFKSTDNGANWTKTIVKDHPLDKYDGTGYGPGDVPYDPVIDDSISILSSDYTGSVLVDDNGKVHVFFGLMYHFAELDSYFLALGPEGIAYWNEDYATDQLDIIATAPDMDGDGIVTLNGDYETLRYNNTNYTSFPTSSIDDDGNIYVVFNTLREDLVSFEGTTYRHVFIVKSSDGGQNWTEPFDLINSNVTEFFDFIEGAYPSIPARIGAKIDLVYMQDYEPGLTPTGTNIADQFIMHVPYDKETFEPSYSEEVPQLNSGLSLSPNPAREGVNVQFELNTRSDVQLRIYDMLGQLISEAQIDGLAVGPHAEWLDLNGVSKGMYLVQLEIEGAQLTQKLVISD